MVAAPQPAPQGQNKRKRCDDAAGECMMWCAIKQAKIPRKDCSNRKEAMDDADAFGACSIYPGTEPGEAGSSVDAAEGDQGALNPDV